MTTPSIDPRPRTSPLGRRVGVLLGVLAAVLLAAGPAVAQDNDDDGVLPFHEGSESTNNQGSGGGSSGSGSSTGAKVSTTISVAGHLQDAVLDASRVHLELSTAAGGVDHEIDEDLEGATFEGGATGLNVVADDDAVRVQGGGSLALQAGLSATVHAASDAVARMALLVLDDGEAPLADVLAGKTQPQLVVPLGDLGQADLVTFQRILDHHAADLPGVHATLVFGSVDGNGVLHLGAVRGSTSGGPLEIATP